MQSPHTSYSFQTMPLYIVQLAIQRTILIIYYVPLNLHIYIKML